METPFLSWHFREGNLKGPASRAEALQPHLGRDARSWAILHIQDKIFKLLFCGRLLLFVCFCCFSGKKVLSCFPFFSHLYAKKKNKQQRSLLCFAVPLPKFRLYPAHGQSKKCDSLLKHCDTLLARPRPNQPEGFYCFYLIINKLSNCLYGRSK